MPSTVSDCSRAQGSVREGSVKRLRDGVCGFPGGGGAREEGWAGQRAAVVRAASAQGGTTGPQAGPARLRRSPPAGVSVHGPSISAAEAEALLNGPAGSPVRLLVSPGPKEPVPVRVAAPGKSV